MEPIKGKWASSRVDLGYHELFCIPEVHQCSSRFVTVFLGTLWCSIKKIVAPNVFNWEYFMALHEMQGNQASSPSEGYSVMGFLELRQERGYILVREYISSQGISVSTQLEAAKSGSVSHDYCSGKAPLEVLVESWRTCSIESLESAFFLKPYGLNRAFLEFLC